MVRNFPLIDIDRNYDKKGRNRAEIMLGPSTQPPARLQCSNIPTLF